MPGRRETPPDQALLIGVSAYQYHLAEDQNFGVPGDIPAAHHNVERMKSALQAAGLFPDSALRICDHTHSEDHVLAELTATTQLSHGLLLFYYCGHAMPHLGGKELWLPLHSGHAVREKDSIYYTNSLRLSQVLERLGRSHAKRIVVILDCCYAGTAEALLARLPRPQRKKFILLLGVQSNRRVDAGSGEAPTPYTHELTKLLAAGHHDTRDLAQCLADIAAKQEWKTFEGSKRETVHVAGHPKTVIRLEPTGPWDQVVKRLVDRFRKVAAVPRGQLTAAAAWVRAHRTGAVAVVTALAVFATGAGIWHVISGDRTALCVPPQEIRLLTDPELEKTVRAAAHVFEGTAANKDADGCLRGGITVYSAPADQVVKAFREEAAAWQNPTEAANPARDIGPQPDVWIPATSAELQRAEPVEGAAKPAELSDRPVALPVSPLVLAVPEAVARKAGLSAGRPGRTLGDLLVVLQSAEPGSAVRRTDPEAGAAGLLATQGLYAGLGSVEERKRAERRTADGQRAPAVTGEKLLCELSQSKTGSVDSALVPAFLLNSGVDCGRPDTAWRIGVQPDAVPGLDPVFIRVRWAQTASAFTPVREGILKDFETWLTGPAGRDQFTRRGFVSGGVDRASADSLNTALAQYRKATGPGRVLFLIDSSGSMASHWEGDGGVPGLLKTAFKGLGPEDEYGVWGVASKDGASPPYSTILEMGSHPSTAARKALDDKAALHQDLEADPYQALELAVEAMAGYGRNDDRPQLIVLLTDDEDSRRPDWQHKLDNLTDETREQGIPIVMGLVTSGVCADGSPNRRITDAAGGRCLDAQGTLAKDLAAEVAWVGAGEEERPR